MGHLDHGTDCNHAYPDFQSLMLPLLKLGADGSEHTIGEAVESLAKEFKLTDEERRHLLPSGTPATFDNRAHWARSHLKQAGLLTNPGRGRFQISEAGKGVLTDSRAKVDIRFLNQFEAFRILRSRKSKNGRETETEPEAESNPETPREALERAHEGMRRELIAEVRSRVCQISPERFERLVVQLLVKMGYGGNLADAGRAIGGSGDEGIDGIIKEDHLGLDVIYVQAKRWEASVGRPEIQKFAGALQGQRARKGVFITTSEFSDGARDFAGNIESRIVLIDGEQLASLMIVHELGVSLVQNYPVKRLDSDFFDEE